MLREVVKWCLFQKILFVVVSFLLFEECSSAFQIMDKVSEVQLDRSRLELSRFVSKQEKRLGKIKGLVNELRELSGDEIRDPNFTVHHPLNAYRFIRNHSVIYNETATSLIKEIRLYEKERARIDRITSIVPTVQAVDVDETIFGLLKLQSTNDIPTKDIADGIYLGTTTDKMTARECQDIMVGAYRLQKTEVAREWLQVALMRVSKGDITTSKTKILIKGAATAFGMKDAEEAITLYNQVINLHPRSRYHKLKMKYYMKHRVPTENSDTATLEGSDKNDNVP